MKSSSFKDGIFYEDNFQQGAMRGSAGVFELPWDYALRGERGHPEFPVAMASPLIHDLR
jgi:hypothetical protein